MLLQCEQRQALTAQAKAIQVAHVDQQCKAVTYSDWTVAQIHAHCALQGLIEDRFFCTRCLPWTAVVWLPTASTCGRLVLSG